MSSNCFSLVVGLLHDIGKAVDHEMEGSHIQLGVELCRKYKESPLKLFVMSSNCFSLVVYVSNVSLLAPGLAAEIVSAACTMHAIRV